jgi:hypothetical protein
LRIELGVVSAAAAGVCNSILVELTVFLTLCITQDKQAISRLRLCVLAEQSMKVLTHRYGELLEDDESVASWASRVNFPNKNSIVQALIHAKSLGNPIAHRATAVQIAEAIQFTHPQQLDGFTQLFEICFHMGWNDRRVQAGTTRFYGPPNVKVKKRDPGN